MTDNLESTTMERINHAIKLTSTLISAVNEFIWGINQIPEDLEKLLEQFQSLGKVLSGFRNGSQGDQETRLLLFRKLTTQNGPLVECVTELKQLHLRIKSDKGEGEGSSRLGWLLDKNQLLQYKLRIEKHKNVLALASQLLKDQSKLSEIMAENYKKDTSGDGGAPRSEPPNGSADLASVETMKRRKLDLEWLFSGDFESRYLGIQERRIKGTGEWLLQTPVFKNWMNRSPGHNVLWGCAKVGAGKTFISSKVIDHVRSQASTQNSAVGYYFFDRMDQDQISHNDILSSLIVQLALQARYFSVVSQTLYSRLGDRQQLKPNPEKLFRNLIETTKSFDQVFLVFDGVDEYNQHEELLLKFLQNPAAARISLFVTSNSPPTNLHSSLHSIARIDLSARAEDIKMSIEKWVGDSQQFRLRLETGRCRDRFIKEMTNCVNGMLLFVDLGMRAVIQQPTVKCIFALIEQLECFAREEAPFFSIYSQCIGEIRRQDSACSTMALKTLSWLVKAQRALTVDELRQAISVEPETYELEDADLPDAVTIVSICAGLIMIDRSSGVVRFIHDTARQYLQKCSVVPLNFDYQMAMACLTYLSFHIPSDSFPFQRVPEQPRPFLNYASRYLSFHINNCDESLTTEAFLRFIRSSNQVALYLETHQHEDHEYRLNKSPLVVAAQVGHLAVVRALIARGERSFKEFSDFNDGPRRSALHEAVIGHHYETTKLLLQELRDGRLTEHWDSEGTSEQDRRGKTVLHWASRKGFKDIVELLLRVENKVDIMIRGQGEQTALHEAARGGHEGLVTMFLEKGIPLWEREECGRTPLHVAVEAGYLAIVRLLLKYSASLPAAKQELYSSRVLVTRRWTNWPKGWDGRLRNGVSAQDRRFRTPLHLAALGCHTEIFQLLLREGADVSAKDESGETVLHQAARGGSKRIVELLVQVGANIGDANEEGVTILHRAASRGYTDMVQLLLDNDVDTSPRLSGRTALQLAMEEGYEETARLLLGNTLEGPTSEELNSMLNDVSERGYAQTVKLLLDSGANDINAALYKATTGGHLDTVRFLLGAGSDILSRHENNETVLHTAAYKCHVDIVKLLLENGADVRARSIGDQTPLHMAAQFGKGSAKTLQLLLEAGADVNARDSSRETALILAARSGTVEDVQLLILHGADVFGHNASGQTALHKAAYRGEVDITKLLLDRGVDIFGHDASGATALHNAVHTRNADIIKLLLDRGANISARNGQQKTALLLAAESCEVDIVKQLLDSGADLTESDANRRTPLLVAAGRWDGSEIVQLLIHRGGDINERDSEGRTAFLLAVEGGASGVVGVLLKNGASISERDKGGESALFIASRRGRVKVVRVLLENGADVSETNADGETALFMTREREVFELLVKKGANEYHRNRKGEIAEDPDMYDLYDGGGYDDYSPPISEYGW